MVDVDAEKVRVCLRVLDGSDFSAAEFPDITQAKDAGEALDRLVAELAARDAELAELRQALVAAGFAEPRLSHDTLAGMVRQLTENVEMWKALGLRLEAEVKAAGVVPPEEEKED